MIKNILKQKIYFVKAVYGEKQYKNCDTVQFDDKILVGWYIPGYPTLKDLEWEFSDDQILEMFEHSGRDVA